MHLGIKIPGRDGSLLQDCLRDAIASYRRAEGTNRDPLHAYIQALVNRAADLFKLAVTAEVDEGTVAWDPLAEPYAEFESRHGNTQIVLEQGKETAEDEVEGESALLLGTRLLPVYLARNLIRTVVRANASPKAA